MSIPTAGRVLVALAEAIDAQDWEALRDLLATDLVVRFPHTGERFDREGYVALNRDYPGAWRFVHEDVVDDLHRAALRARVSPAASAWDEDGDDGGEVHHVACFGTTDETGRLRELVELWAEAGPPPTGERRPGDGRGHDH